MSGWMALQPLSASHPLSWGMTLSSYPDAASNPWALSLCRYLAAGLLLELTPMAIAASTELSMISMTGDPCCSV